MSNIDFENTLLFEFDGELEFITYCSVFKDQIGNKQVIWSKGTDYADLFMKGFELFEQKQYKKAIKTLEKALDFNPIGLRARFEIAESYIALKDYDKAREVLFAMKEILTTDDLISRFYRRLGFMFVEEEKYEVAYACFVQSKKYENSVQADKEIEYILTKASINKRKDVEKLLKDNDVPVLAAKGSSSSGAKTKEVHQSEDNVDRKREDDKKTTKETKPANTKPEKGDKTNSESDSEHVDINKDELYCRECGTKLNKDSEFCHKCATRVTSYDEKSKEIWKCSKCGKRVPEGSKYCQFCGSKEITVNKPENESKEIINTINKPKKASLIIAWLVACLALCGCAWLYSQLNDYKEQIASKDKEISSLNSKNSSLNSQLTTAKTYQAKASKYDKLTTAVKKITSYSDLYANKYILYKPSKERVYVTLNTGETIWAQCSSGLVTADWSKSWNGYQTSIIITYSGSGVETVKIYPDKRESHAIYIVVFG